MELKFRALRADEIDVRVQSFGKASTCILLYKDARVDQNILDETVGALNWQKHYSRDNQNCTVSIWDSEKQMWVSKEDTGTESNTEKEKGLASDSFKRACVCWGIGRELYSSPVIRIPNSSIDITESNGRKNTFDRFFVDKIETTVNEQTGEKKISTLTIGIDHGGQTEWVWSWNGKQTKSHTPAWRK